MKSRIKPLIKKMGRSEIVELCERKGWDIITTEDAKEHIDEIPYRDFWVAETNPDDEDRPYVATVRDGKFVTLNCSPSFLQHCVVVKRKKTTVVLLKDAALSISKAIELDNVNDYTSKKFNQILLALEGVITELGDQDEPTEG